MKNINDAFKRSEQTVSQDEVEQIFDDLDFNQDGKVTF